MRLRKHTVKTQVDEPTEKIGRFRLVQRLKTQCSMDKKSWFKTHKYITDNKHNRHLSRFSGNLETECFVEEASRSKNIKDLLDWYQDHHSIGPRNKNRKEEIIQTQCQVLKNHISNVETKRYESHRRTFTQPAITLRSSRKKRTQPKREFMEKSQYEQCCGVVDDIYRKITILREIGYADTKINDWMIHYCESRKAFLKDIFMKNVSKSLYSMKEEYQYIRESSLIKERIMYKIQKGKELYSFIEVDELQDFSKYIEEILIQKNCLKSKEVQESIIQKLSTQLVPKVENQFFIFTKKEPTQVYNFVNQLISHQQKYGNFQSFSKISKLRFLQLNRVQKHLKNVYQELKLGQSKKLVKTNATESYIQLNKTNL